MNNQKLRDAIRFIVENYGLLVTENLGQYVCECCGNRDKFASNIKHSKYCVFTILKNANENMQLSFNFA